MNVRSEKRLIFLKPKNYVSIKMHTSQVHSSHGGGYR